MNKTKLKFPASLASTFWRVNWLTTITIVVVVLGLIVAAVINANRVDLEKAANERALPILTEIIDGLFPQTQYNIDEAIDDAFAPAYANIPAFTDWHYSVIGQYTELTTAAIGSLDQQIEARLMGGLEDRLANAFIEIDTDLMQEFDTRVLQAINKEADMMPANLRDQYRQALETAFSDTRTRFNRNIGYSGAASLVGASGGVVAMNLIIRTISRKLASSIAAKFASRTIVKATGVGSGATAGAAVGAFGGPIGAGIGGVIGAVAGWLLIDTVVINADEWLNRDDYETELRQMIDAQKNLVKADVRMVISAAIDATNLSAGGKTPSELN